MLEDKILCVSNFTFNVLGGSTNYCHIIKGKNAKKSSHSFLTYHQQQIYQKNNAWCLPFLYKVTRKQVDLITTLKGVPQIIRTIFERVKSPF